MIFFLLTACSNKYSQKEQAGVVVSYKGPALGCEFLGQNTVESKHSEKLENQELTDVIIGDLVMSTCAKNANYIHITKVADELLQSAPRSISSESSKKELHRTKVEGKFYNCPSSTN